MRLWGEVVGGLVAPALSCCVLWPPGEAGGSLAGSWSPLPSRAGRLPGEDAGPRRAVGRCGLSQGRCGSGGCAGEARGSSEDGGYWLVSHLTDLFHETRGSSCLTPQKRTQETVFRCSQRAQRAHLRCTRVLETGIRTVLWNEVLNEEYIKNWFMSLQHLRLYHLNLSS